MRVSAGQRAARSLQEGVWSAAKQVEENAKGHNFKHQKSYHM